MFGPGGQAQAAAQQVQFNLTEKGIDFLGYKTLKNLLGSVGKSSFGATTRPTSPPASRPTACSKPYEFGDVLNLDVNDDAHQRASRARGSACRSTSSTAT